MKIPENTVIIDTCIWASFFARPNSPQKKAVDDLIDADRAGLIGPIVSEILRGIHRKEESNWIASRLKFLHHPDIEWKDWRNAGQLGAELASRNRTKIPLADLVIATVALRGDVPVYTSDPHFDLIPNLKRYET